MINLFQAVKMTRPSGFKYISSPVAFSYHKANAYFTIFWQYGCHNNLHCSTPNRLVLVTNFWKD